MSRAEWTVDAQRDLLRIDDYLSDLDERFAKRVGSDAIRAARFLAAAPSAGQALEGLAARKWRIRRTPYILIYRIVPTGIEVLRVRHVSEDWRPE